MSNTKEEKIERALERWVEKIYPSKKEFLKVLRSGKKLSFYIGIDPTGPDMHLGHSTNYLLMRELQKAGHKIILLIGDFTARIGDPSEKATARKPLTEEQIEKNMRTYKEQAGKILDLKDPENPVEIKFNSDWLSKLTLKEVIELMAQTTFQQLIKRSMFQKRIEEGKELRMHEIIYPLLQGYDSVAMKVDVEVGGTDQIFNMLVGRDLVKTYLHKEKFVLATPLLESPKTGKKLMSKSEGTYVGLNDAPNDMYGKTMALPDEVIFQIFKLCTTVPMKKIEGYKKKVNQGANPMVFKKRLAWEIVKMYHGKEEAKRTKEEFERVFQEQKLPSEIRKVKIGQEKMRLPELLVKTGLADSKSQAKRLVKQGGVRIKRPHHPFAKAKPNKNQKSLPGRQAGKIKKDWREEIEIKKGMVVQVGKRRFVEIA